MYEMCSYIITSPDDITGSWETRKRQFGEGVSWGSRYWNFRLMIQMHAYIHTEAGKMRLNQDLLKEIENNDAPQEQKKRERDAR